MRQFDKLIMSAIAVFALSACSSEDIIEKNPEQPVAGDGDAVAFVGTSMDRLDVLQEEGMDGAAMGGATRSTLTDGEFTAWTEGDRLSVSDGTLVYNYKVTEANGTSCKFDVVDTDHNQFLGESAKDKTFYCSYPEAAVKGWNGSTVTMQVYAEQKYDENMDGGVMGAYLATSGTASATGESVNFDFTHTASVLEVNLATLGVTPKAVYLKSNSGVAIAGEVKCDVSTNNMTISTNDNATAYAGCSQSDVIGLMNVASNATIARFYILPVKLVGGVTVTIVDTDGNYYTKKTSTDIGNDADFTVTNNINSTLSNYQVKPGTTTAAKPFYKKVNFGVASTATRKGNWMATIPSNIWYSMLSAPGTHDSATSGCSGGQYKCQGSTIAEQLIQGVRVFDLRPGYNYNTTITADNLYIYHGNGNSGVKYVDAMNTIATFLENNPTEAVTIVQVKENNSGSDRSSEMWNVINAWQDAHENIFLSADHSNWTLQDMRGKIMFINRNATATHKGMMITGWGDKCNVIDWSGSIGGGMCKANIQDAYEDSESDKKVKVSQHLQLMSANETKGRYNFNYISIAWKLTDMTNPENHARVMNPYTTSALENISGPVGYLMADYVNTTQYGVPLVKAIINQNYKYVYTNRSRLDAVTPGEGIGVGVAGDDYADDGTIYVKRQSF